MNERIVSDLGEYLLNHRDQIINEWVLAAERNADISSPEYFRDKDLVDHLPDLVQNLAALLQATHSRHDRSEVSRTARTHGRYRWRQGYSLEKVIREASIVRRILCGTWVNAFARQTPEFDDETRSAAEQIIHEAVDDLVADSAQQYVQEQQKTVSRLTGQLADALAEVRQEKEAANESKTRPFGNAGS